MDKESTFLLQCLDCNCNDCKFLQRDLDKFNKKTEESKILQNEFFDLCKINALKRNEKNRERIIKRGFDKAKEEKLLKENEQQRIEIQDRKFIFVKKDTNYGYCSNLEKEITFYPNTNSIETQQCFKHRKLN